MKERYLLILHTSRYWWRMTGAKKGGNILASRTLCLDIARRTGLVMLLGFSAYVRVLAPLIKPGEVAGWVTAASGRVGYTT